MVAEPGSDPGTVRGTVVTAGLGRLTPQILVLNQWALLHVKTGSMLSMDSRIASKHWSATSAIMHRVLGSGRPR